MKKVIVTNVVVLKGAMADGVESAVYKNIAKHFSQNHCSPWSPQVIFED